MKGISLFVVPKFLVETGERNDVVLAGLNHKMGYRGTTNTLLNFGEGTHPPAVQPGAVGFLVGEAHKGLAYMFHMMNEARIGVGLGATALGYTGYLHALDYARTRPQGRTVTAKDPASPQVPIIEHADVRRMLLAQKAYVEGALALSLYCGRLVDEQRTAETQEARDRALLLLDVLTPIAKSWPSQWCLEANRPRHPGARRLRLHPRVPRRAVLPRQPAQPDPRGHARHPGPRPARPQGRRCRAAPDSRCSPVMTETIERAAKEGGASAELGVSLKAVLDRVVEVTAALWSAGDVELSLANATVYLEAVGHVVVAWVWLEQVLATAGKEGDFYDGKRQAARVLLPLGAAQDRPAAGPARQPGPHDAGHARRLVLTRARPGGPAADRAAADRTCPGVG